MTERNAAETEEIEIGVLGETHDVRVDPIAKKMLEGTIDPAPGQPIKFVIEAGVCPALEEGLEITAGRRDLQVSHVRTPLGGTETEVHCITL